jgi:peptidoglycan/LPS O-acetylase OafA/YrhL
LLFCASLPLCLWCVYRFQTIPPFTESVAIAVMIAVTSLTPFSFAARVLENEHLKFLGVISYSVYLWQELFLLLHWGLIGLGLLIPVAIASYVYIERPGIELGRKVQERFEQRRRVASQAVAIPT